MAMLKSKYFKNEPDAAKGIHLVLAGDHAMPCPFCGCTEVELQNTWTAHYSLCCSTCYAQVEDPGPAGNYRKMRDHLASANAALRAWNRRTA